MSLLVSVIVSKRISVEELNLIGKRYNLSFSKQNQVSLQKRIGECACYLALWRECEYNLPIFSREEFAPESAEKAFDIDLLFPNENTTNYQHRLQEDREREKQSCERNADRFLRAFFAAGYEVLGILRHWYDGDTETETIRLQREEHIALSEKPEFLDHDVLYWIRG